MAKRVHVDKTLFVATMALLLIGLIMVFSASAVMAKERYGSPYTFVLRQAIWAVGGVLAMLVTMRVDYQRYRNPAIVFALLSITTVLLIAVFFLDRSHNTHRWIKLGVLSFQPSEVAKLALILFLAWFVSARLNAIDDWKHTLLPAGAVTALIAGLIVLEPDLGTGMVCVAVAAVILFVAGMQLRYFAAAFAASLVPLYFLLFHVAWRRERILAFLNPYSDPQGRGFHIIQSMIAVGTGGLTGAGLMEGKQKLFYLPEPHTDFIFAVTAEEFGLIGSVMVVALFAWVLYRGITTAVRARDPFAKLLAVGITSMVVVQALMNISVVLGLMPTKGIPLPLISSGGSSLFVTLASLGVLLNITRQTE